MANLCKAKNSDTAEPKPLKIKWNVIKNIHTICDCIHNNLENLYRTEAYKLSEKRLENYFNANEKQVWILSFAIWAVLNGNDYRLTGKDLADFFEIEVLKIASWNKDFVALKKRRLLDYEEADFSLKLNTGVLKSVLQNVSIQRTSRKCASDSEFAVKFKEKVVDLRWDDKPYDDEILELVDFENTNKEISLVAKCKKFFNYKIDRFMFYFMCERLLSNCTISTSDLLEYFYEPDERIRYGRDFLNDENTLLKMGFLEFVEKGSLTDSRLDMTEKGREFFLGEDAALYEPQMDKSLLTTPDQIKGKKLFYSPENQEQIDTLKKALDNDQLGKIRDRLKKEGYPVGIAVLLYGEPGTGKTESVLQLAKQTGRAIVQVDIANTKSCWFGESEKKIKSIFHRYKKLCENAEKNKKERLPILLFNEADAVFSKRQDVGFSNTAQTENAIQNIILNEMENQSGIIIATTNMVDNLDAAFERRFLFKIRFDKPTVEAKKAIWMSKLKWLRESDAETFARDFNFSGGEIDNIVRKVSMKEVISGKRPDCEEIMDICRVEKLANQQERRMGFAI